LLGTLSHAQTNDFGIWTSAGIEKQAGRWNLQADAEVRTQDNSARIDRWSLGLSSEYKLAKPLSLGLAYQFIEFHDVDYADYQPRHRFTMYITGRQRFGDFTFTLRERIQLTTKDESDRIKSNGEINTYAIDPDLVWRNRIKLTWNVPRFPVNPSVSFETFYQLNNPDGNSLVDLRTMLAFRYKLSKAHSIEIYGLYDREINIADPVTRMVAGLSYVYKF
jgi:hypothetical protein